MNSSIRMPLEDLMVFHKLARSLTSSLELDDILRTILDQMNRFVSADLWALLMLDEERNELYYALTGAGAGAGLPLDDLRVKVGEGLAGWVAQYGQTLILPQADDDPRLSGVNQPKGFRVRSAVAIPIRGRRGTHGVLEILNPNLDDNSDYTIAFLHILADYAAIAIENAQDVARAQQLTITDDVTGLFNARHLYTLLEREIQQKQRNQFSLLFLDLDKFKLVNDVHGHLIGSELLGGFGRRLRALSRKSDQCFRYGGDEFVVLMPKTPREEAMEHSASLHQSLTATVFRMRSGLEVTIGSSVGLATFPADGKTVHAILGIADKRMYSVKASGRGRVGL